MRTFTPEEIRRLVAKDLAGFRDEFSDLAWAQKLVPLLEELLVLVETQPDFERLTNLEHRMAEFIRSDKQLKGLQPYLWMIASLKRLAPVA